MIGNCALCPAVGVEVASTYKERDLGNLFCFCCRMRIYNLMERQRGESIAARFDRMAAVARLRAGSVPPVRSPSPAVARRASAFTPRPAASWAALSCPPSDL